MLKIDNAVFGYTDTLVLKGIDLTFKRGTHLALLGESGCGKSTLLKVIYGLYDLKEGTISWNDQAVLGPAYNLVPGVDEMKYLAQDFDLEPYTTVAENIGKFISNAPSANKKERVEELMEMVEMSAFASVKTKFLSGGQQQRVALARVLASDPELLLLDEPFSHIDNFRRSALRRNLFAYLKAKGISCIVATHDCVDALGFADETIIMQDGRIIASGDSKELYEDPGTKYIASLFGEVNELKLSDFMDCSEEDDETLLFYPHQFMVSKSKGVLEVEVKDAYFKGDGYMIKAAYNKKALFFDHPFKIEAGTIVHLALKKFV